MWLPRGKSCGFGVAVWSLFLTLGPLLSPLVPLSPCPLVLLVPFFLPQPLCVFIVGLPHKKNTFTIFQSGLLRGFPLTIAPLPHSTSHVFLLPTALILIIFLVFNSYFCGWALLFLISSVVLSSIKELINILVLPPFWCNISIIVLISRDCVQ